VCRATTGSLKAGVPVGSQRAEGRPRAAAIAIFRGWFKVNEGLAANTLLSKAAVESKSLSLSNEGPTVRQFKGFERSDNLETFSIVVSFL
jgi:hypothetical protein